MFAFRVVCLFAPLALLAPAAPREQDFSRDPGWESHRNRLLPDPLPVAKQDFGYSRSQHAGGKKAGEVGGWVQRAATPAWYARRIPTRSLNDRLTASGRFSVKRCAGGSGVLFGWFHESSRGWRTPNSLVLRIDGNRDTYRVYFEYGTQHWRSGGGATFPGRYQTTKTPPLPADGTAHTWSLVYDPAGNGNAGLITFTLDGKTFTAPVAPGHKADGAQFNRFGLVNVQMQGKGMEVYFDDLVIDGHAEGFDRDPGWEGRGNRGTFAQRVVRPRHDFGFSKTRHAGGMVGEIGGVMWRDPKAAYHGDRVGPFTLDDELHASGRITFQAAASDSAGAFGWFDSASCKSGKSKRNLLGIVLEGPSRVGHYFRPEYATATGVARERKTGPLIRPDGKPHRWSLHYDPRGAEGKGRITFSLDEERHTWDLEPGHRKLGARFDRFGLLAWTGADGHFVEFYLDDLSYTATRR